MVAPNFVNRTVWTGDNLDILRGMNSDTVDLIYLDPPFNSNRNYEAPVGSAAAGAAFKDAWTLSDLDVAWMGLIADEHPPIAFMLDTAGKAHGKGMQSYLTMMAARLLEMQRVLKPTGSIYLHCDPTASHYLKMLMDAIFGALNYRDEIVWNRAAENLSRKKWRRASEIILYYSKSSVWTWNPQYDPLNPEQVARDYRYEDDKGRYTTTSCTNNADRPNMIYEFNGNVRQWRYSEETMLRYEREGMLVYNAQGIPRRKRYLSEVSGRLMTNVWSDIKVLSSNQRERTGYPTQKPLALLERVIAASSNEGDVILDPFCGCATACIAAEKLDRQWVGVDLSPKAAELVNVRLREHMGDLFHNRLVTTRTDIPKRTDIDAPKNYRQNKHVLYGRQEGRCGGCQVFLEFRHFEVDHVVPQSRGGMNHIDNLQLLCGYCNRTKGNRPQEYLIARLKEMEYATA